VSTRRGGHVPGGWRGTEVWLNPDDVQWFGELGRTVRAAVPLQPLPLPLPLVASAGAVSQPLPGLVAPAPARRNELPASRRRRLATRLAPTVTGVVAAGVGVPLILAAQPADLALPAPSPAGAALTQQAPAAELRPTVTVTPRLSAPPPAVTTTETVAKAPFPTIRWRESRALGVPHIGTLVDGVRLPQKGPDWVTWDPVRDRVPNRAVRLYGTDELVRMALDVIAAYRLAHPNASRVVIGDLSLRGGGEIDEHASHENGLDLDVYYPRTDRRELPPASVGQVDVRLAQDLLDRFVTAGASVVFVGYSVPLHGRAGVVVPYANHDNHMHVRIGAGGAVSGD
jgi:hypothetical protein